MSTNSAAEHPRVVAVRRAWSLGWIFASPSLLFGAFVLVPLIALAIRGWQDGQVMERLLSPFVLHALRLSVVTSTLTLVLALVFGVPAAYLLARGRFRGRQLLTILVELPMVLPPTVAGVALLVAFGRRGAIGAALVEMGIEVSFTTTAVILAQLFVSAPFLVRSLQAGFEAIDPTYEQVSATLGVSELRTFLRVTLPLARPALLSGAVLCWTRALSELGATLIFAGNFEGRTQTMPLAIITAFESSAGLSGAIAISLVLLVVASILLVVARLAQRRSRGSS
ncbi:MAG: molybdate ABC transporter permease subunit [Dehalococcoidia bacterium]|nr:molybdate ABC transporter permease subunit [Dehalococcoidia bacterium]